MPLDELLTCMLMEMENDREWEFDHNTSVLTVIQRNLASLLKASLIVSNNLRNPELIDSYGMINGLTITLEWLLNNKEEVKK